MGDGKTAIRAGYGIFYDSSLYGTFEQNVFNDPPFTTSVFIGKAPFTDPCGGNLNIFAKPPAFGGSGSAAFIPLPWHTPYTQQWNLDVQRQLSKTMLLDVDYYGNNAHHLLGVVDINQVQPVVGAANVWIRRSSPVRRMNILEPVPAIPVLWRHQRNRKPV